MPIFELDRDIYEIHLYKKFQPDDYHFFVSYRVNGRPDTLTDSRVYSLFEYTKMKMGRGQLRFFNLFQLFDGRRFGNGKIIRSIDVFYKSISQDVIQVIIDRTNIYEEQRYVERLIHLLYIRSLLLMSAKGFSIASMDNYVTERR